MVFSWCSKSPLCVTEVDNTPRRRFPWCLSPVALKARSAQDLCHLDQVSLPGVALRTPLVFLFACLSFPSWSLVWGIILLVWHPQLRIKALSCNLPSVAERCPPPRRHRPIACISCFLVLGSSPQRNSHQCIKTVVFNAVLETLPSFQVWFKSLSSFTSRLEW